MLLVAYYSKTKRHFKVFLSEHMGVSARTGKNLKLIINSAVFGHMLVYKNMRSFADISVLANESNDFTS